MQFSLKNHTGSKIKRFNRSICSSIFIAGTLFCVLLFQCMPIAAEETVKFQRPPESIAKLAEAPGQPRVIVSPNGKMILIASRPSLKPLEDLVEPELKLAGIRINPETNSRTRNSYYNHITLKNLVTLKELKITDLPGQYKVAFFDWSPDSTQLAILLARKNGMEIWTVNAVNGKASRLTDPVVNNTVCRSPMNWLPDNSGIIFTAVYRAPGQTAPQQSLPEGPAVRDSGGKKAPVATYRDLLKNPFDEAMFSYYATAQLMKVIPGNEPQPLGKPGIISRFSSSPDGQYIWLRIIKKPFSYMVPYYDFPLSIEVWDHQGNLVKKMAQIPVAENVLNMRDAARKGPMDFQWRADVPATLYWVEALDEGNPLKNVKLRNRIYFMEAPFNGPPKKGPDLPLRFYSFMWGNGRTALINLYWWKTRKFMTVLFKPDQPEQPVKVVFDRNMEDKYNDPGIFLTVSNKQGKRVLLMTGSRYLYLQGDGASPEGNRPFIDRFSLNNFKSKRLWRSKAPFYEAPADILDISKKQILFMRESKTVQPNYFISRFNRSKLKQVTFFPHPYESLKGLQKQFLKFKRSDGLDLTGTLYLPPGYKVSDGPLPALIWAYPREFKSRRSAGQVSESPYRFTRMRTGSVIPFVTQGYAVFDRVSMPVVGEGKKEPNDTFVQQLVDNARAAIDKLVEMKVADRARFAVGGHSYGAFMTANLLTHSNLFAAGIARSGAYNRTLTPFGFQNEERTYWDAPEIYFNMSPFMHAQKIKTPILLIHGQMDNNSGTFPIQSERYFHALKGHSAIARLVILPFEAHGYRSRENVLHMYWETWNWLEKYVKNKKQK